MPPHSGAQALLRSPADAISPLCGVELVEAKVQGIAWMGGRYPSSQTSAPGEPTWPPGFPEHNFGFRNISNVRRWHLCGWIERIPGGTRQNDGL